MIETRNLTKEYGDVVAVDGVDLAVEAGSLHGFVGPNGAGKTTTMQMLVGLLEPTQGEAFIDGEPAGSLAARRSIGYAPQETALYESMTGREYLVYMGEVAGMDAAVHERADELLEWLDLVDAADRRVGGYSGGMRRRLSLAQAMIHDPDLLILDEPTAALDPSGRMAVIDSLEDLAAEGMTVFVSSHVLSELEQFVDTVTILDDGQVVQTGPVDEVAAGSAGATFAVETDDDERLVDLLADRSWVESAHVEDGAVVAATADPDAFRSELQSLLAEEGILLESLGEVGGLEAAFEGAVQGGDGK